MIWVRFPSRLPQSHFCSGSGIFLCCRSGCGSSPALFAHFYLQLLLPTNCQSIGAAREGRWLYVSDVQATLFNALGQAVLRQQAALPASSNRFEVQTAGLATGVYILRLQRGSTTLVKRVVLQ
ncbi:T9SS type A sorting domain-containing protein [Hymenobacter lucidus]|uniref:T9SS type A sorting domain-containing protein n=1 Tax=Hymenobacter lucidus TaxID=2880930 RepID=A0ABS8AKS4_9BACT|nr:T9SS type A sorting domain-containing protein [Hymenobacter lucidus]